MVEVSGEDDRRRGGAEAQVEVPEGVGPAEEFGPLVGELPHLGEDEVLVEWRSGNGEDPARHLQVEIGRQGGSLFRGRSKGYLTLGRGQADCSPG